MDAVKQYKTNKFTAYVREIIFRLKDQTEMAVCEAISFLTRVLILLYLQEEKTLIEENGGNTAFYYIFQLLSFQRTRQKEGFRLSKQAIVQTFNFLTNDYGVEDQRIFDLLDRSDPMRLF